MRAHTRRLDCDRETSLVVHPARSLAQPVRRVLIPEVVAPDYPRWPRVIVASPVDPIDRYRDAEPPAVGVLLDLYG